MGATNKNFTTKQIRNKYRTYHIQRQNHSITCRNPLICVSRHHGENQPILPHRTSQLTLPACPVVAAPASSVKIRAITWAIRGGCTHRTPSDTPSTIARVCSPSQRAPPVPRRGGRGTGVISVKIRAITWATRGGCTHRTPPDTPGGPPFGTPQPRTSLNWSAATQCGRRTWTDAGSPTSCPSRQRARMC